MDNARHIHQLIMTYEIELCKILQNLKVTDTYMSTKGKINSSWLIWGIYQERKILFLRLIELLSFNFLLNPGGGGRGGLNWLAHCGFSKNISSKQKVKPWFLMTFNIIISHVFPENFIDFPHVVQKIWKNSLLMLAIFINFPQFFEFFEITLLQRNWWRQLITDDASIFQFQKNLNRLFHNWINLY